MAHPELELITNIVDTGDFVSVKKEGITRDIFTLPSAREVFVWLWDEFHNPKQRGEVPTPDRLKRKFPDFDFSPSRNSISALVDEIRRGHIQLKLNQVVDDMRDQMLSDAEPELILSSFLPQLRDLNVQAATDNSGISLTDAASLIRQEYYTTQTAGGITGVPWPWEMLNIPTGGMQDEEFIVIYGRPGNMKTWLACVMAAHAWNANRRVLFFSKEISSKAILRRITSVIAQVDYAKLSQAKLSEEEEEDFFDLLDSLEDIEEMEKVGAHRRSLRCISDKGKRVSSTVDNLIAEAERFRPDIVFVDGFYLLRDARSKSKTADWKNIAHISQDLKSMAQYLECPVIGTSQANRANASKPSTALDDLSFADSIGMDADVTLRAFRGPNPKGYGASIMLVPTKVREATVLPFVINAVPSTDFSVLQKTVNVKQFLLDKERMEQEEAATKMGGGDAPSGQKQPPKKRKPRNGPFRE